MGDDEGILLETPEELRARAQGYVVNDNWNFSRLRGETATSNNRPRGNAEAQNENEAADEEGYIGGLRRSMRLRAIARVPPEQANPPARSARQRGNAQNNDDDAVMHEEDVDENASDLEIIRSMCETYCYRLNLTANSRAIEISQRIGQHIFERIDGATRYSHFPSLTIAAVSAFMTSHLTGMPKSMGWVAMNASVLIIHSLRGLYWYIYHTRFHDFLDDHDFIDEEMLAMIGRGDRETVLGFLPEAILGETYGSGSR